MIEGASTTSTPTQEDWVLICQPRGASQSVAEVRLVQLRRNAKLALGQSKLSLGPLVGVPFGTNFLVEHSCRSGGLALVRDDRSVEELLGETGNTRERLEGASSTGGGAGSIEIDDGSAQRLDVQQIKRLKAESASGDSVVIAIAQGSRTFASKSSFAQVKYLRKKARKHMQFVSALRPTALALSDMYAAKAPEKLLCLRRDSLALLLSLGGLQPGARALVLEGSSPCTCIGQTSRRYAGSTSVRPASVTSPRAPSRTFSAASTTAARELMANPESRRASTPTSAEAAATRAVAVACR
jgi:tRNA (adenine-N(1)-)-methyltransferase non-catalytic subunit